MISYIAKRVVMAVAVVYIVVSLSFLIVRLMPGNPMDYLEAQLERQGGMTPQQIQQQVNAIYGLMPNQPLWQQYLLYIAHAAQGNLGSSLTNPGQSVIHIIAGAIPWTVFAVGVALILSFLGGMAVGTLMAAFQHSRFTKVMTLFVSFLSAVPNYMVAIVLIYFVADMFRLLPSGGAYSADVTPGLNLPFIVSVGWHALLPIASYSIVSVGGWALQMKGSAISTLGSEYVRAAEARGLGSRRITQSYVGRNSMLPQVTLLALSLGFMFGGSVFIESYFNYPGIGNQLISAVNSRDYSVMMGCFVLITVSVVLSNLVVDLVYPIVDPRIVSPGMATTSRLGAKGTDEQAVPAGGSVA